MNFKQVLILSSQNIAADLKGSKLYINCTTVGVRGDVLWLPHDRNPAAASADETHNGFLYE